MQNISIGEEGKDRIASRTRNIGPEEAAYMLRTRKPAAVQPLGVGACSGCFEGKSASLDVEKRNLSME